MGEEKSNVVVCEHMRKLREWLDVFKIPWFDFSDDFSENLYICRTKIEYRGHIFSVINGYDTYGGFGDYMKPGQNMGLLEFRMDQNEPEGSLKWTDVAQKISQIE